MSLLKPKLIQHVPGIVFTFEFPLVTEGVLFPDVNVKAVAKELIRSSIAELKSDSAANNQLVEPRLSRRSNPYENIIERLERKYTAHRVVGEDYGDVNDDGYDDEVEEGENPTQSKAVKRKKMASADTYDLDDPFVDDSDEVALINMELKKKRVKTVHDGFFVNNGQLEVHIKDGNTMRKRVSNNDDGRSSDGESVKGAGVAADGDNIDDMDVDEMMTDASGKLKKFKPDWKPPPVVLEAVDNFRKYVASSGTKLSKHAVPTAFEDDLIQLDKLVQSKMGDTLSKTTGYYETLAEIFGGEIKVGKVKWVVKKLQFKDAAEQVKRRLDETISQLQEEIKSHLAPISQTPFSAAAVVGSTAGDNDEKIPGTAASATAGTAAKPPAATTTAATTGITAAGSSSAQDQAGDAAAVEKPLVKSSSVASLAAGLTFSSMISPLLNTEGSKSGTAAPSAATSSAADANANAGTAEVAPAPGTVSFKWQCEWTLPMKSLLAQVEVLALEWIPLENSYRGMLTNLDKKTLEEEEYDRLDEKDALADILKKVCEAYPPMTYRGDVTYLKKLIHAEKMRGKRRKPAEEGTGGQGGASAPSSSKSASTKADIKRSTGEAGSGAAGTGSSATAVGVPKVKSKASKKSTETGGSGSGSTAVTTTSKLSLEVPLPTGGSSSTSKVSPAVRGSASSSSASSLLSPAVQQQQVQTSAAAAAKSPKSPAKVKARPPKGTDFPPAPAFNMEDFETITNVHHSPASGHKLSSSHSTPLEGHKNEHGRAPPSSSKDKVSPAMKAKINAAVAAAVAASATAATAATKNSATANSATGKSVPAKKLKVPSSAAATATAPISVAAAATATAASANASESAPSKEISGAAPGKEGGGETTATLSSVNPSKPAKKRPSPKPVPVLSSDAATAAAVAAVKPTKKMRIPHPSKASTNKTSSATAVGATQAADAVVAAANSAGKKAGSVPVESAEEVKYWG